MSAKIAFVGLIPAQTWALAQRLEAAGFQVYWIQKWPSERVWLESRGVTADRILDTSLENRGSVPETDDELLARFEIDGYPMINDIILMDRHLRRSDAAVARRYMSHICAVMETFLRDRNIDIVSTRRDTALQIVAMSVAAAMGIFAFIPTRLRLPKHRYGFTMSHEERRLLPLREPTTEDEAAARTFLEQFAAATIRPLFIPAVSSARDIVRSLPRQLAFFGSAIRDARFDRGNRYSRWTVADLARMYLRKKKNLLTHKFRSPFVKPDPAKGCLIYAMHSQPESGVDVLGSFHSDQFNLISQIARATPATYRLYVKLHPAGVDGWPNSYFERLGRIPGVEVMDPTISARQAIELSDIVFTVSSTIAYEAGLLGRNAVTFSQTFFNDLPTVHYCEAPRRLPDLVRSLLGYEATAEDRKRILRFVTDIYANSFEGEVNRFAARLSEKEADRLTEDELESLVNAYTTLARQLDQNELPVSASGSA